MVQALRKEESLEVNDVGKLKYHILTHIIRRFQGMINYRSKAIESQVPLELTHIIDAAVFC
jgi:hypothetical protein